MFQKFNVVIEPGEDGWFVVTVPGLPGCITQGKTIDEATKNAKEAIEAYLEIRITKSLSGPVKFVLEKFRLMSDSNE